MSQPRFFRRLVRLLFPEEFRVGYESEMVRTFAAQHAAARESGSVIRLARLWVETLADLVRTAPREHLAQLRQDVTFATRTMQRAPGITVIIAATIAVAIGANTAMFSVVHAVLLRPLPYADAGRVAMLWNHWPGADRASLSIPELLDFRERARTVDVAAWADGAANLTGRGEPERVRIAAVTVNLLQVLGVTPALGRDFRDEEELTGDPRLGGEVVLLSDELWRRRFGAASDVVGRRIVLDRQPVTVVGILPRGFALPTDFKEVERIAMLRPLVLDPAMPRNRRGVHFLKSAARVRPGFTLAAASAEIAGIAEGWRDREWPGAYDEGYGASLVPVQVEVTGDVRRALLVLLGAVGLVLLIACANVANLLLARGQNRLLEVAVRKAAGASESRLVRQALTEGLTLAAVGAVAGIALAHQLTAFIVRRTPQLPRIDEVRVDGAVLLFTVAACFLTAVVFGVLPALQMARRDAAGSLSAGSRRSTSRHAMRGALVSVQVALALMLFIGASLLVQSFVRLVGVPSGVDADRVLTMRVTVPLDGYREREATVRFFETLIDGIRSIPDVRAAGGVSNLPLSDSMYDGTFYLPGETTDNGDRTADFAIVTPGYFETIGARLLRGRFHARSDTSATPGVAVINETLAHTFFGGSDPLGQQIRFGFGSPWTIIGIVEDVRHQGLSVVPRSQVYLPQAQFTPFWPDTTVRSLAVLARTTGDPLAITALVRSRLRELDPTVPLAQVMTMDDVLDRSVASERLQMVLLLAFAGIASVLAVVGTYGVLAYQVAERTREIGVRMLLGARRGAVMRLIVRQGMTPAVAGVIAGLIGAALVSRVLDALLFETEPLDLATFAAAAGALTAAAVAACLVPAGRAVRLDPASALRAE